MKTFFLQIGKVKAQIEIRFIDNNFSIWLVNSDLFYHEDGYIGNGVINNNRIYLLDFATEFHFFKSEIKDQIKINKL